MSKPSLLFRGPVKTRSGYGAHARDILKSLYDMDLFKISIDACPWGNTPQTALEDDNSFHNWIKDNIVTRVTTMPDIYIQVTVPNEFQKLGKVSIGVTAGIETTVAPKDWIDGCNRMDHIITTSNFSKEVLLSTIYDENDLVTNQLIKKYKIEKPISILFEGVDTNLYNNEYKNFDLNIKEDFAFLFVGHWLKGNIGQDRKDVGMLIKVFAETFKDQENQPALILKTSSGNFSVIERERLRTSIETVVGAAINPPSIYLIFGELMDSEMNQLYNHPKVKAMISLTKGEGFGRPLLEFTMTGKPVIASNWSGHKDFLPNDKAIMIGGTLTDAHSSAIDSFIIKDSKWFTANYNEASNVMRFVKDNYDKILIKSEQLRIENKEKFSFQKMTEQFKEILKPYVTKQPVYHNLILPKLKKIG